MTWNRREHLKWSVRHNKSAAAEMQAIADAGGSKDVSLTRATSAAQFYNRMADEALNELQQK